MATYLDIKRVVTSQINTVNFMYMHENAIVRVDDTHVIVAASGYSNNSDTYGNLNLIYIEITETGENLLHELELTGACNSIVFDTTRGLSVIMLDSTHGILSFYTYTKDVNCNYVSWIVTIPFHLSGTTIIQDGYFPHNGTSTVNGASLINYNSFDIRINMCIVDSTHYAIITNYPNSWDIGISIFDSNNNFITNIVIDTLSNSSATTQSHSSIDKLKDGLLIINYGDKGGNTYIKTITYDLSTYAMSVSTSLNVAGDTGYNLIKRISDTSFAIMFTDMSSGYSYLRIYFVDTSNTISIRTETHYQGPASLNVGDFCINNSDNLTIVWNGTMGFLLQLYNIQSDGSIINKDNYSYTSQTWEGSNLNICPIAIDGIALSYSPHVVNTDTYYAYIDRYKLFNQSTTTLQDKINIGGVWKNISSRKININGNWKTVKTIVISLGGKWKNVMVDTSDTTPPSIVSNLTVGTVTENGIQLSWDAATDNIEVTEYNIWFHADGDDYQSESQISETDTTTIAGGLLSSTKYYFKMKAKDAAGNISTDYSNEVTATTLESTHP